MPSPILHPEWKPSKELDTDSLRRTTQLGELRPVAHIHISGVCGTGTGSVLQLLKACGFYVTGSDKAFYPPMGDVVRSYCDKLYEGYAPSNLEPRPDCVIIGNSLSKSNPEVQAILEQDIPFASMPEAFAALLIGTREYCPTSVVVAGTHGKTTTTAAIATLLDVAGRKPGYFIGGVPKNLPGSLRRVDESMPVANRVVVLEGDEYDSAFFSKYSKFHSYRPDIVVVTSIEFDHADIYNSVEEIELEFTRLARRVPKEGVILVADEGERLDGIVPIWREDPQIVAPILRYGAKSDSPLRMVSRTPRSDGAQGQALHYLLDGQEIHCSTPLSGDHNAKNLLAAAAVADRCGVAATDIARGVATFSGVLRRQNVIAEVGGRTIIEDFAHHPTAVKVTLEGLKESYAPRRLIAVFEPRSNTSRRAFFQEEYPKSFGAADVVVIQEVADAGGYSGTAGPVVALNVPQIARDIAASGKDAVAPKSVQEIVEYLKTHSRSGDVIVLMSNGDFGGLPKQLPEALGSV